MHLPRYAKALVSGIAAGAASLVTALTDSTITTGEGVTAVLAVLGALGITWATPNREPKDSA
jgi:hypothetical protein